MGKSGGNGDLNIPLGSRRFPNLYTVIDDEDADLALAHTWNVMKQRPGNSFYAFTRVKLPDGKRKTVFLHRLIMGAQPGQQVDHIDMDGLNNQRSNLRLCTNRENCRNTSTRPGSSKYRGVGWVSCCSAWRARIVIGTKRTHLGLFDTEKEAAEAYDNASRIYYGEFGRVNFPKEGERAA